MRTFPSMVCRLLILCWFLALCVKAEEKPPEIIAYHVGKMHPTEWLFHLGVPYEDESKIKFPRLEEALFQSRFFTKGDILIDASAMLKYLMAKDSSSAQIIYNETTGKVVLRGDLYTDSRLRQFVGAISGPNMLRAKLKFLEISTSGKTREIQALSLIVKPGQKALASVGNPSLRLEWEPNVGANDAVIDSRFSISGTLQTSGSPTHIEFVSGFTSLAGFTKIIELGTVTTGGSSLTLSCAQEALFADGTSMEEAVLYEKGGPTVLERGIAALTYREPQGVIDSKGRVFSVASVPPSFLSYVGGGEDGGGGGDPFAEDELEEGVKPKIYPLYQGRDPRVLAYRPDHLVDATELFRQQGMKLDEGEFVVMNTDSSQLFSLLDPEDQELREAIVSHTDYYWPQHMECRVTLIEGDQEFSEKDLARDDLKKLHRISSVGRPGLKCTTSLKCDSVTLLGEFEPNIGANDDMVDLRAHILLKQDEKILLDWSSRLSLRSGQPVIAQRYRAGDKWRAVVVEVTALSLEQEVREKK